MIRPTQGLVVLRPKGQRPEFVHGAGRYFAMRSTATEVCIGRGATLDEAIAKLGELLAPEPT